MRAIHRAIHRAERNLYAIIALVTLAACSSDATGPASKEPGPNDPAAGAFTLNTVNARALPYTLFNDSGFVLEITLSTVALQTNGQFVLAVTTRETVAGFPSSFADTTLGTWTQEAGEVEMIATNGQSTVAAWDGVRLSFPMDSDAGVLAMVFRKDP